MKVCLAALIPLLLYLLVLASDVSGRRRIRQKVEEQEGEYEVSHIQKRGEQKLSKLFSPDYLSGVCSTCHTLWGINATDCNAGALMAKYECMLKMKERRQAARALAHDIKSGNTPAAGGGGGEDEYEVSHIQKRWEQKLSKLFSPDYLSGACSICHTLWGINANDCNAGINKAKYECMMKTKERRQIGKATFHDVESGKAPETGTGGIAAFFKPAWVQRTCKVCEAVAFVNFLDCVHDETHAKKCCVAAIEKTKEKFAAEFDNYKPPAKRRKVSSRRKFGS